MSLAFPYSLYVWWSWIERQYQQKKKKLLAGSSIHHFHVASKWMFHLKLHFIVHLGNEALHSFIHLVLAQRRLFPQPTPNSGFLGRFSVRSLSLLHVSDLRKAVEKEELRDATSLASARWTVSKVSEFWRCHVKGGPQPSIMAFQVNFSVFAFFLDRKTPSDLASMADFKLADFL